jgi:hypothetical protein
MSAGNAPPLLPQTASIRAPSDSAMADIQLTVESKSGVIPGRPWPNWARFDRKNNTKVGFEGSSARKIQVGTIILFWPPMKQTMRCRGFARPLD